jgi:hypothetical protein
MKKIMIIVVAAMSLAAVGCKKKGGMAEAMAKMGEFKDKMCKCTDAKCAQGVTEEMTKWSQEQAKGGDKDMKPSEDDAKKIAEITKGMTDCMTKAMGAGMGGEMGGSAAGSAEGSAAAPAGGSAEGSAAPAGGSAAPAGGSGEEKK